jgi:uncharacterized protein YjfI (DUF2170 family)
MFIGPGQSYNEVFGEVSLDSRIEDVVVDLPASCDWMVDEPALMSPDLEIQPMINKVPHPV